MKFNGKAWILAAFIFLVAPGLAAQNPALADSLIALYHSDESLENDLPTLKSIADNHTNPDIKLEYAEILITKAAKDSLYNYLHSGFLQKGNAMQLKGNYPTALDSYFRSLNYANLSNNRLGIGAINISIADTYSMIGNSLTSKRYYDRGIAILREVNDSIKLGSALLNVGDESFNSGDYDEALEYFSESGLIFKAIDYPLGRAYNLGNVGMVYAAQGKHTLAKKNINEAIEMLEELEQYYPIAVYLSTIADIYAAQNNIPNAFDYAKRSHELATRYGLKDQIGNSNLQLANLYEAAGNYKEAYKFYKNYIVYRDSVTNLQAIQQMADLRTDFEISQKQTEVDLLAQQKRNQKIIVISTGIALVLLGLLAFGLYRRYLYINKMSKVLGNEKDRSDKLLLNILPEQTARELKEFGRVKSQRFESVSVLFADFKDFTNLSEYLDPEVLVESVDFYFSKFDEIIEKYGLEKIKTVGDCYMCAGGLPFPSHDHAHSILLAALDMTNFVKEAKENQKDDEIRFDIRIGVNTGPVVAGVVGSRKFAYDIWGDTVNIASRMETNSEAGRINISHNTYQLVKFHFECEYRGKVEVKSKGSMKMYYVNAIKFHHPKHDRGELVRPEVQV
ncbi:tetratricopeptide repeat protein [Antarcticibacterium arcticum]|uniref:Adenylate cyclase n=1 Tax=Antarcticibacterium arcticum TaxID=2585771 RepID=A0A5B8YJ15_9FLAO|nr:adenylate/guanylate cyclase domain-containing protein [Antarcticibacterium arcticum]QED37930.1 tetratricopeptide repeat protein [Antarcticibacterium arcticum]